jgi:hypothetical protein
VLGEVEPRRELPGELEARRAAPEAPGEQRPGYIGVPSEEIFLDSPNSYMFEEVRNLAM